MKNEKIAILAAAKGYTVEQIKPWVSSLNDSKFAGKKIVIVYDDSVDVKNFLDKNGVMVVQGQDKGLTNIATQRFQDYAWILKSEHCKDIDLVIHTDIRDVIFQHDPGKWLLENIGDNKIIVTGEGVTYRHEDWNGDGLQQHFGKDVFDELVDEETICSGIIAGEKNALVDLFNTIHELAFYSADPGGFIDQHFHNIAIRKVYSDITRVVPADEDWVCNCGTLVALPMNNPAWSTGSRTPYNSYERFRKGTYVENMLVDLPVMKGSDVCTPSGKPYAIVHQYDRYQPWKERFLGKEKEVTVVTALYDLNRGSWKGFERGFEQYKDWMKRILTFDSKMVIYVEPKDVEFVADHRKGKEAITKIIALPFEDLRTNKKWGSKIRKVMSSESFRKDQTAVGHPQIEHPEYNILMHEKIQFVKRAIEENPFQTDHYMWLDAGVYHMSNRNDLIMKKFPETTKVSRHLDDKLSFICVETPNQSDLELEKFYKGHNVRIIGTSWLGHKDAILKFEKSYDDLIKESLDKGLMDQDQSFLTICALRNPELCNIYKGSWQDAINLWS